MLLRVEHFDDEVDDVARGAELPGVALRAQHREQVLEGVAQALGVVVLELVDDLQERAQRLRVAVGQVGVLEDVAKQRRNAGVLGHAGDGFGIQVERLVAAEAGAHEPDPAILAEAVGEELALAAQLLALGVHVVHELVDQRDGDLLDLALGVGHLADQDVAGGVDAAFGGGVEHGNPGTRFLCGRAGLFGREAQAGKIAACLHRPSFDLRSRLQPAFLLQKNQERARADLAAVVGHQKAGAGDLVILEQKDAGFPRLVEGKLVHGFLYCQFAQIRFARRHGIRRRRLLVVRKGAGGAHRDLVGLNPLAQFLAGRRLLTRHFMQHHIDQHERPAGLEQQVERIRVGQRNQRPGVGQQGNGHGHGVWVQAGSELS